EGRRRVDVIYRRVDDEFLDPVAFRPDSLLGCPGLINAARAGTVTIANMVGNGVADDKLVYTYVPDLIRYYLGEEPILANVDTWRLEEPEALAEVLDRLPELVVKPVDGSGGKGIIIGPAASRAELDAARTRLRADPRGWIAQPVVQLSTVPTLAGDSLRPRHVDLRPFAVNDGENEWVLPGALTHVALAEGQLVVNSSKDGDSKDTWVLGSSRRRTRSRGCRWTPTRTTPRRASTRSRSSSSRPERAVRPDALAHRRVAVLDRPLRRAGRRHRPHPRRPPAAAAGGPLGRGGPRVPLAARCHGCHRARRGRRRHAAGRARHPRVGPDLARIDRGVADGGPRERAPRP